MTVNSNWLLSTDSNSDQIGVNGSVVGKATVIDALLWGKQQQLMQHQWLNEYRWHLVYPKRHLVYPTEVDSIQLYMYHQWICCGQSNSGCSLLWAKQAKAHSIPVTPGISKVAPGVSNRFIRTYCKFD
jgi:hypothetical protein